MIEDRTKIIDKAIEINETLISRFAGDMTPAEILRLLDFIVDLKIKRKERQNE